MTYVSIADAQQKVGELVVAVGHGEEVVITVKGEAVAKLTAVGATAHQRHFGSAKGLISISADFEAPLPDFAEYQECEFCSTLTFSCGLLLAMRD